MRTFNKQAQAEAFKAVYDDDAYWLKHEIDKGAQINLRIDGSPRGERDEKNEMLDKTIAERVLLLAMNKGEETDCLKYLKYHDVNIKDLIINTILPKTVHNTGRHGGGFLRFLIDNWPAKVWGDWRKELDLHSFASANDHGKVTVLLENGVDVDGRNQEGKTALMLAKNQETAEALIKGGADIHAVDANGKTPLWHGTQHLIKMIKRNNNGGMTKIPVHECGLVIEIIKKGGLFDDPFALQSAKLLDRRLNKGLEIECWDGQGNLEDFKLVRPALDVILAMGRRERLDNLMSAGVKKQRMKNQNVKPPRM